MSSVPSHSNLPPIVDRPRSFFRRTNCAARCGGFSLVETVLAIGVVAFAFVPIVALLPIGMTTFHKAMDTSVATLINQQIVDEAQETDFSTYVTKAPVIRYFTDEGEELTASDGGTPAGAIYQVNVRIVNSPTLPGAASANENLSTITIQVANNPGNVHLAMDTNNLWTPPPASAISVSTYSTVIAGNNTSSTN